jgi:hypothetical protein
VPSDDHDTTAISAVAAIRPTTRDVFLPPETHAAVAAIASDQFNFNAINEHLPTSACRSSYSKRFTCLPT